MLTNRQAQHIPLSTSIVSSPAQNIYFCEPSTFSSECLLSLRGKLVKNNRLYVLEHGETYFELPVSGKIVNITVYPDTPAFINDQNINIKDIKTVNKGDRLSFLTKTGTNAILVQIHLHCPLLKDE